MQFKPYNHSEEALNERIRLIVSEEKKKGNEKGALKTIFQSIDFTTLEAFDNAEKIKDFGIGVASGVLASIISSQML